MEIEQLDSPVGAGLLSNHHTMFYRDSHDYYSKADQVRNATSL
jgi:hypothetical protein